MGLAFSLLTGTVNGMPDRLCRDSGDLRHPCHGHADLRVRPLFPVRPRCHLPARSARRFSLAWVRARCSAFPFRSSSSRCVCLGGHLFLRYARSGRYLRAVGDNLQAARITGVPTRPIIVLQYVLSSLDRLRGRHRHRDLGREHEHARRQLDLRLRRDPGRGSRRHRPFRRQGRHPQRHRRHACSSASCSTA